MIVSLHGWCGMNGCRQLYISVEGSQCIASVRRCKPSLWVACSVECWMDFEYIQFQNVPEEHSQCCSQDAMCILLIFQGQLSGYPLWYIGEFNNPLLRKVSCSGFH